MEMHLQSKPKPLWDAISKYCMQYYSSGSNNTDSSDINISGKYYHLKLLPKQMESKHKFVHLMIQLLSRASPFVLRKFSRLMTI